MTLGPERGRLSFLVPVTCSRDCRLCALCRVCTIGNRPNAERRITRSRALGQRLRCIVIHVMADAWVGRRRVTLGSFHACGLVLAHVRLLKTLRTLRHLRLSPDPATASTMRDTM